MTEPGQPTGSPREAADILPNELWSYDFPVLEERSPAETPTGLVDLGFLGAAFGRSKRIWVSLAAVGLIVGAGLFVYAKPSYQVTANVLVNSDPAVDPETAIQTASQVAQEPVVVQLALKDLGLPGNKLPFTVAIVDPQVLSFTLSAPTAQAAVNEGNVVANDFLTIRNQQNQALLTATISGEKRQLAQEQQTVQALDSQINQLSSQPAAASTPQELANLQAERAGAENALSGLIQQQATARVTTADMQSGSKILSVSTPVATRSRKRLLVEYVGGAFFGGLALGLIVVAIGAVLSDRLYRRDDVAAALGAPVKLSVVSGGKGKWTVNGRGAAGQQQADLDRVAEYLGGCVPDSPNQPGCLAVIALDNPGFVAEAVTRLAALYARDGRRTAVADLAGGVLARRLGLKEPGTWPVEMGAGRVTVALPDPGVPAPLGPRARGNSPAASGELAAMYSACDVLITLAVLDPAVGADHLGTWAEVSVAVVTAGESSVMRVQGVGEMVRETGGQLTAGILIGADKRDESLGLVRVLAGSDTPGSLRYPYQRPTLTDQLSVCTRSSARQSGRGGPWFGWCVGDDSARGSAGSRRDDYR